MKYIKKRVISGIIDTVKISKIKLLELGITEENIIDSNICTVCNSKYINSYRADKEKFK